MCIDFLKIRRYNLLYVIGIITLFIACFQFWRIVQDFFLASLLSILFVATLAIGSRLQTWISLVTNRRPDRLILLPNWTTASLLTVTMFFIIGLISNCLPVGLLMFSVAILLNVVYSLAKIRCWVLGCCSSKNHILPVQIIETCIYFCFAILLITLKNHLQIGMLVFAFFYPCSRLYFHRLKLFKISYSFILTNITIACIYGIVGFQYS